MMQSDSTMPIDCVFCEYYGTYQCDMYEFDGFCQGCKDYPECDLSSTCRGGAEMQCNNGYEEDDDE